MSISDKLDKEIMERAAMLETEISPSRDLWPEIEAAIAEPVRNDPTLWNAGWAQAAAIVLLIGGSSGMTWFVMNDSGTTTDVGSGMPGDVPQMVFQPVAGSFGSQYNLGPDYTDARGLVQDNLDERLAELSPEARDAVRTNIEAIREAINEINLALADDPDNVLLQELLIDAYRDELSIMKRVEGISNAAMFREDI